MFDKVDKITCGKCGSVMSEWYDIEKDIRRLICPLGCRQDECPRCGGALNSWNDGLIQARACQWSDGSGCGLILSVSGQGAAYEINKIKTR